jgi:hypothetical protein
MIRFLLRFPGLTALTASGLLLASLTLPSVVLAQAVTDIVPAANSTNIAPDTSIAGQFDISNGGEVDTNSVRVFINGQDVTSRSTITRNFFSYRPEQPFPPGPVQVQVQYRGINGQPYTAAWTFIVQAPQTLKIDWIAHNAADSPINSGSTLSVTINGTPRCQASVLIVQDEQTVRELPAREVSPGVYVANLTAQQSDRVIEGIVIGRLRLHDQTTFGAAPQPIAINPNATGTQPPVQPPVQPSVQPPVQPSVQPSPNPSNPSNPSNGSAAGILPTLTPDLKPRFTSHQDGDRVGSGFTLQGQTRPGATVAVKVVYGLAVVGIQVAETSLVDQSVTADREGRFQVDVPAPPIPLSGLEYKVRAIASDGTETSPPTDLVLRQQ